jgi:hypothetical protein
VVTSFSPVVTAYSPVVTYSPVTTAPTLTRFRAVTVRPKVYVSGQPVRNVLRAITP